MPLGLTELLHDGFVFLITGIVKCYDDACNIVVTMLEEHSCWIDASCMLYKDMILSQVYSP